MTYYIAQEQGRTSSDPSLAIARSLEELKQKVIDEMDCIAIPVNEIEIVVVIDGHTVKRFAFT